MPNPADFYRRVIEPAPGKMKKGRNGFSKGDRETTPPLLTSKNLL